MGKEIRTEVEIDASAQKVWDIITGFAEYPEWNPFIRRVEGRLEQGSRITIHLTTPSGTSRTYGPKITKIDPPRELRWLGKMPGLMSGEHVFEIVQEPGGRRVKLVHREVFGGLLSSFFGGSAGDIRAGFEQMNLAIKKRAEEGRAAAGGS
ncbi:SRPBCC domain-containing protein [Nitrososphaera sp.]|uniref:SRPBCC domain-containing protein n=1 Tax=Nitrososphaera sp. TaxID=1971748 RepID=UPI00307D82AC